MLKEEAEQVQAGPPLPLGAPDARVSSTSLSNAPPMLHGSSRHGTCQNEQLPNVPQDPVLTTDRELRSRRSSALLRRNTLSTVTSPNNDLLTVNLPAKVEEPTKPASPWDQRLEEATAVVQHIPLEDITTVTSDSRHLTALATGPASSQLASLPVRPCQHGMCVGESSKPSHDDRLSREAASPALCQVPPFNDNDAQDTNAMNPTAAGTVHASRRSTISREELKDPSGTRGNDATASTSVVPQGEASRQPKNRTRVAGPADHASVGACTFQIASESGAGTQVTDDPTGAKLGRDAIPMKVFTTP